MKPKIKACLVDNTYLQMNVGALSKSPMIIEVMPSMVTVEVPHEYKFQLMMNHTSKEVIRPMSRPLQTEVGVMTDSHTVEQWLTQRMQTVVLPMSEPHMM